MSTKIHHGFKLNIRQPYTLEKIDKLIKPFRKIAQEAITNNFVSSVVNKTIEDLDYEAVYGNKLGCNFSLFDKCKKERTEESAEREYTASLIFIPLKNKLLGLYYAPREVELLLHKQSWFIDYCYFDNTDKPDNISNKVWNKRRKDWDSLGYTPPVLAGFSYYLVSQVPGYFDVAEYMHSFKDSKSVFSKKHIPAREKRLERYKKSLNILLTFNRFKESAEKQLLFTNKVKPCDLPIITYDKLLGENNA